MANNASNNPVENDAGIQFKGGWAPTKINGKPIAFFEETYDRPLRNKLSGHSWDRYSMLETLMGADDGSPTCPTNPNPTQIQMAQHANRLAKLFHYIMSTVDSTSPLYTKLERECNNNGIDAFKLIKFTIAKKISMSSDIKMETEWNVMSMDTLGVVMDEDTVFNIILKIKTLGAKFSVPKTIEQQYQKILRVLPKQLGFKVAEEMESPNPAFDMPPTYVAPHPLAPKANPDAGCKDLDVMGIHFSGFLNVMIDNGDIVIKELEANAASTDSNTEEAYYSGQYNRGRGKGKAKGGFHGKGGRGKGKGSTPFRLISKRLTIKNKFPITNKTCCYRCGGLGHIAVNVLPFCSG